MLKMICSDAFVEHGQMRPPIVFNAGLNTVLGDDNATNSIGKSTFLMIIDFVFGGDDYLRRSADVHLNVGVHAINFVFAFDDGLHYFSRNTGSANFISICDESFTTVRRIAKDEYLEFLRHQFQLDLAGLTFRSAVGRFFRIHGRETLDAKYPLRYATQERQEAGIEVLLKLFSYYEQIQQSKVEVKKAQEQEQLFKGAQKYQYLTVVNTKVQYQTNLEQIAKLEQELQNLQQESRDGVVSLATIQAENAHEIQQQLALEKRQYIQINHDLTRLEQHKRSTRTSFENDLAQLASFFPTVDLQKITAVEYFHEKLCDILKAESKKQAENLTVLLNLSAKKIAFLTEQLAAFNKIPNVNEAILTRFGQKQNELFQLKSSNRNYLRKVELKTHVTAMKKKLEMVIAELNLLTATEINAAMADFNRQINAKRIAPQFEIIDSTRYQFVVPNDHGTGSQNKGLIIFDLALLALTNLPALIHDSVLLKQIEDDALENLLACYAATSKQVFIAFDKKCSFSKKSQNILDATTVLELAPESGALFGRTWNEKR